MVNDVSIGSGFLVSVSFRSCDGVSIPELFHSTGIFISSNLLGSLFQIASLPVVILAPLGAVSLLWNAFFARLLLGDVFSPYMIFGTIAIAGGAVLIAVFGIVPEPTHSLESLLILFARKAFVVYFTLLGTAVIGCLVVVSLFH